MDIFPALILAWIIAVFTMAGAVIGKHKKRTLECAFLGLLLGPLGLLLAWAMGPGY